MELQIASKPRLSASSYSIFHPSYAKLDGFAPVANFGLGAGIPAPFAQLKRGDIVLDLGCGEGSNTFIAAKLVGEKGAVIGLDSNPILLKKAMTSKEELGLSHVEFRLGEITQMPIKGKKVHAVIGQSVLNQCLDKLAVYKEIYRVLKPGGHFSVTDIVIDGVLPDGLLKAAALYVGHVQGAVSRIDYLSIVEQCGFEKIQIKKDKLLHLPPEILAKYVTPTELHAYQDSGVGIHHITLYGIKPAHDGGCGDACTCGKSKKILKRVEVSST